MKDSLKLKIGYSLFIGGISLIIYEVFDLIRLINSPYFQLKYLSFYLFLIGYPLLLWITFTTIGILLMESKFKEYYFTFIMISGLSFCILSLSIVILFDYQGQTGMMILYPLSSFNIFLLVSIPISVYAIDKKHNKRRKNPSCYNCGYELISPFRVCIRCKAIQKKIYRER